MLTPEAMNTMRAHAERTFPEECVGAVLSDGTVVPLENVAANRRSGFALSARDCLAVEAQGVLGYYHSHPDGPAEPSKRDEAHATPDRWMFIIRVVAGVAEAPRAFRGSPLDSARRVGRNGGPPPFVPSGVDGWASNHAGSRPSTSLGVNGEELDQPSRGERGLL